MNQPDVSPKRSWKTAASSRKWLSSNGFGRSAQPRAGGILWSRELSMVVGDTEGVGVDTFWLTDVLTKLVNLSPASRIDELMPYAASRIMPRG